MTDRVLLNNVDHADMRVALDRAGAGDQVNRLLLFPTELGEAQREYAILIARDGEGQPFAFALLGLDRDENLFVEDGRWRTRYRPALAARGPFSIGLQPRDGGEPEPMVHVDLSDPRVGADDGERLFLPHGGNAPALEEVARVLRRISTGHPLQRPMFDAFAEAGLLRPVRLELAVDDGLRYDLLDFETVGAEQLAGLPGEALARLHARGFLAAAFHIAGSRGNVEELVRRKRERLP